MFKKITFKINIYYLPNVVVNFSNLKCPIHNFQLFSKCGKCIVTYASSNLIQVMQSGRVSIR